ncbi:hypothetical protein HBIAX_01012 [Achromobacter xylosoxidans]|nr:hypothetical protein HBIAX_01012 [Achromobacter xylosoxidans]
MPGLAWAVARRGICGIMPDVPDRPPLRAPIGEEPTDLALRIGIISLAPTGMVNRTLQVDQQKYGTAWGKWGTHVDRPEICESIGWARRGRKAGRNRRYSATTAAAARRCRTNPAASGETPKVCIGCTSACGRGSTIPRRVGWKWAVCFDAPRPATLANMSTARGAGHAEFCVRAARLYLYRVGCGIGVSFGNEPLMRVGQFEIPHLVTMPFSIMNFSTHT